MPTVSRRNSQKHLVISGRDNFLLFLYYALPHVAPVRTSFSSFLHIRSSGGTHDEVKRDTNWGGGVKRDASWSEQKPTR